MASPSKTHLYKILDEQPPHPLPETLPLSDLDKKDEFIHLSEAWRIIQTADLFFRENTKLWLLKLRIADLDGRLDYPAELPGCAHVHGSSRGLGSHNIEEVIEVDRAGKDGWAEVEGLRRLSD